MRPCVPAALALLVALGGCTSSGSVPEPTPSRTPVAVTRVPTCPHHVPRTPDNVGPPSDKLVWRNPTVGKLCRYYPLYGLSGPRVPHGTLYGQATLDTATARKLARILDRIPSIAKGERIACPAAFGTHDLLTFGYADGRTLQVLATPDGCPSFTNLLVTTGDFSPAYGRYLRLVDHLVPPKTQHRRDAAPSPTD